MRSIRGQLLLLAAIWLSLALVGAFVVISALLREFVTDRYDAEAATMADALFAVITSVEGGAVDVKDAPADLRFSQPFSGYYWQVEDDGNIVARSKSLLDAHLRGPSGTITAGIGSDQDGAGLRVLRRELTIPDSDAAVAVTVTVPQLEIDSSLRKIIRPLSLAFITLGIGLAGATLLQVSLGLRSLGRLRRELAEIRAGRAERLPVPEVSELRPLANEINANLAQQADLLARSRHHLGNLAHALKTPLSAMSNDLPGDHLAQDQIGRMDRLIGWHLRRARSAGRAFHGLRCEVRPVIDDILMVLRRPIEDKGLVIEVRCSDEIVFGGERQDLEEMIGNLSDNAVKWARSRILLQAGSGAGGITIRICDDGPGMTLADSAFALTRGGRLDEQGASGSGLGLAIVTDLAALYGGRLRLETSDWGGLCVVLELPGF